MPGMMDTILNLGTERKHGSRSRGGDEERTLRVGLLSAIHSDVRRRRDGRAKDAQRGS